MIGMAGPGDVRGATAWGMLVLDRRIQEFSVCGVASQH